MYPEWVLKYHVKGTTIKKINDKYYLYKATSKYVKEKGYPVSIQKYIGRITEDGLIEPDRISFTPGVDKIVLASTLVRDIDEKDKNILDKIAVMNVESMLYIGKITQKEIKVLEKYFKIENFRIWRM